MFRLIAGGFALALVALTGASVSAEDKKEKDKPVSWVRESGEVKLTFQVGKETAKYVVAHGDNEATITAKVKWDKDTVSSEVTDVTVKGNFPSAPKKGEKISFKWVVKGDKATLSDLTGDNVDGAKDLVEGEYTKKK